MKSMQDRVFVDTNILIYSYSETEPEKKDMSLSILARLYRLYFARGYLYRRILTYSV